MSAQKSVKKNPANTGKTGSKNNKGSKRKNLGNLNPNYYIYLAIPLYLIIALVPLIVYVKKLIINDPGNLYWNGSTTHYDIFSYYKVVYLLVFTGAGLLLYLLMKKGNPLENAKRQYYIPAGILALLTLISAITSEYKQVAYFGFLERFEGAIVLIAYCVILFLAMNILQDDKTIQILFGCFIASAVVISILGIFQYFGLNYFDSQFVSNLITPADLKGGKISPNILGNSIYSTLYNPNYVGSYMSMLIPILIILIVWLKKLWQKLAIVPILLLVLVNLVGSGSRAGFVGTGLAILALLIFARKSIWSHKWIALAAVFVLAGGLTAFNLATNGSVVKRIVSMVELDGNTSANESKSTWDKALAGLSDVKMDAEKLQLVTDKGSFIVKAENNTIKLMDENNAVIQSKIINDVLTFSDKRFKNIKITAQPDKGLIAVYYNGHHLLDIAFTNQGFRSPDNIWLTFRNDKNIESFGFKGMESYGSNRGYIWSRSIPLLNDTILIGKGPDTFPIYFPQYDFLGKLKFYHQSGIIVDKPHNMYLQTAMNTGVISLLALLAIFALYFISSVKTLFKYDFFGSDFLPAAGAACFAAFCGYAAAAFFNDSVVSVAPVFWVLLGSGIGINLKLAGDRSVKAS